MTINIEELRKDMDSGAEGPYYDFLAREYLALREAADALASQAGDVINSADEIGDYVDPMISMPLSVVSDLGRAIKAYRKATQ